MIASLAVRLSISATFALRLSVVMLTATRSFIHACCAASCFVTIMLLVLLWSAKRLNFSPVTAPAIEPDAVAAVLPTLKLSFAGLSRLIVCLFTLSITPSIPSIFALTLYQFPTCILSLFPLRLCGSMAEIV